MYDFSKLLFNTEEDVSSAAVKYIKQNKKELIKHFFEDKIPMSAKEKSIAIFMAGSPGAGKTESSKIFIQELSESLSRSFIRIDPDEIRKFLPHDIYCGDNSFMVQMAASKGAHILVDHAITKRFNFILDGTLSNIDNARNNIKRVRKRNFFIEIFYIYQDPLLAWDFTKKREALDGRCITKEIFVEKFFLAMKNANQLKFEFLKDLRLHILSKNTDNSNEKYYFNQSNVDFIIKNSYDEENLLDKLD